ncbi:unnamed protein product [Schistosoma mattheei]|uniref:Uncharacterized protein n=1 Tax=Schistosoma mattheei TaxID=31246 RepID=A0A3P8E777_9TREM|nr:unnamed protein product [Schistosoma mattheei]
MVRMLEIVLNNNSDLVGRFDVLTSLNSMLSGIPSTKRNCLWNDCSLRSAISNFGAGLRDLGDFDLQAHSSALLLRLVPREIQRQFASTYIIREFPTIAQEFSNIGGVNFEFVSVNACNYSVTIGSQARDFKNIFIPILGD